MRAGDHPDSPTVGELRQVDRQRGEQVLPPAQRELVAGRESAAVLTAEAAEHEGRSAAEYARDVQSAFDREVPAHARAVDRADVEDGAGGQPDDQAGTHAEPVDRRIVDSAADADQPVLVAGQHRPGDHALQSGRAVRIADRGVDQREGEFVGRAGRRYADVPQPGRPARSWIVVWVPGVMTVMTAIVTTSPGAGSASDSSRCRDC